MSNFAVFTIAWLTLAAHLIVGVVTWKRFSTLPLMPLLNLASASCVLAYQLLRTAGAINRGARLYLSDQGLPLYALIVVVLSVFTLTGRITSYTPTWIVFTLHLLVTIAALVFFFNFKITRLF